MERVKLLLHQYKYSYSDFEYYHLHIEKIENNKSKNPDIAIESCKSLIEGISKSVLNRLDTTFDEKQAIKGRNPWSVQKFFGKALSKIAEHSEEFEASFIHSTGQIVNVISATRTDRGDISHGKSVPKLVESSPEFAEMVTNMTDLIVSYTLKYFFQIDTTDKEKLDYFPENEEKPTENEENIIKYNSYLDESQPDFPISTTSYSQLLYENDYDEYETRFYDEFLKTLEPDEDSDKTEKEEPAVIIEVSSPTIENLVKEFFADVFWTDKKNAELTVFAEKENLKKAELKQVINFYLDEEKEPFPDSVKETMIDRPTLLEFRKIKRRLTQKIIEFAKSLNNDTK
jgi:hypothetical protein